MLLSMLDGKKEVSWAITTSAMDALDSVARPKPDGREFSDSDAPRQERGPAEALAERLVMEGASEQSAWRRCFQPYRKLQGANGGGRRSAYRRSRNV